MAFLFILFFLPYAISSSIIVDLSKDSAWSQHKRDHGLKFSEDEEEERRTIFLDNLKFIEDVNSKNKGYRLAMNKFGHLRASEIGYGLKMKRRNLTHRVTSRLIPETPVKKSHDWRNQNVITHVKDQGHCGSCYAFSAVGAIESHHALRSGVLEYYSEQEIVDCSTENPDSGCDGGLADSVFKYAMKNGLSLESDYPYTATDDKCKAGSKRHYSLVSSFVDLPSFDEHELVRVLSSIGPVSIGVDADHDEFRFYESGILDIGGCSQTHLNHAVLAVGFNTEGDTPYLIVKNSWGTRWGEDGYFRIALYKNMCGVASEASYPIIRR